MFANTFNLRLRSNKVIALAKPSIMGVINMSPNSFYQPIQSVKAAISQASHMVAAGAHILDVGGEATNPFVNVDRESPSIAEEMDRVVPVIEALSKRFDVLLSVDTSNAAVMEAAVEMGAHIVNDQRALAQEQALAMVAKLGVPVCLMHYFTTQRKPDSSSKTQLFHQIYQALGESIARARSAGIRDDRIIIDPGFGGGVNYGKSTPENFYLLTRLPEFTQWELPVLAGWSRKSMIGEVLQVVPEQRLYGSIAAACLCMLQGASIIRVHDVAETADAIKIITAYLGEIAQNG